MPEKISARKIIIREKPVKGPGWVKITYFAKNAPKNRKLVKSVFQLASKKSGKKVVKMREYGKLFSAWVGETIASKHNKNLYSEKIEAPHIMTDGNVVTFWKSEAAVMGDVVKNFEEGMKAVKGIAGELRKARLLDKAREEEAVEAYKKAYFNKLKNEDMKLVLKNSLKKKGLL